MTAGPMEPRIDVPSVHGLMEPVQKSGRYTLDYLTEDQAARVAALHEARFVLTVGVSRERMIPQEFPYELVDVAEYVLTGRTDQFTTRQEAKDRG